MRKIIAVLLGLALLAGCAGTPTEPTAPPTASTVTSAVGENAAQKEVLDGFISYGADTAGGSLKSARAAAALVVYLRDGDIPADAAADWRTGLSEEQEALLVLNWPDILANAKAICTDPAGQADLLASAGVDTDFTEMELDGVPEKLDVLDGVLGAKKI